MEKKLSLSKDNDKYILSNEDIRIEIENKKIDAQVIYDKIYSQMEFNDNSVSVKVETALTIKEDIIIFNQIKTLFKKIDEAINLQLSSNDSK